MTRKLTVVGVVVCWFFGGVPLVQGAPLDDAKALLSEKKYDQVDKALEKELAAKNPSPEALKVSFDAAMASGKIYSAQGRILALLAAGKGKDLDVLYQAATVCDLAVDYRQAAAKYLSYAQQVNDKTDKLETALRYVLSRDAYPAEYKKYLELFGPTEKAWELGTFQLDKLLENLDAEKALELSALLLKKFPQMVKVDAIGYRLWAASQNFALGKGPKERFAAPLKVLIGSVPTTYNWFASLLSNAGDTMTLEEKLTAIFQTQAADKRPLPQDPGSNYFSYISSLKTVDAKLKFGRDFLALEPIYRDSNNRDDYSRYLGEILAYPDVFNVKDKALVAPNDATKKFEALSAKFADTPLAMQGHIQNLTTNYLAADPPAAIAFLTNNLSRLSAGSFGQLLQLVKGENLDTLLAGACSANRNFGQCFELRWMCLDYYQQKKEKDKLLAVMRDYLYCNPTGFDFNAVKGRIFGDATLTADEKLAFVQDFMSKAGATYPLGLLMQDLAKDKTWAANAKFTELLNQVKAKAAGTDPLVTSLVAMQLATVKPRSFEAAMEAGKKFLAQYSAQIPGGWERCKTIQDWVAYSIYDRHFNYVYQQQPQDKQRNMQVVQVGELYAPRLGPGTAWESLIPHVRECGGAAIALPKLLSTYIALCQGPEKPMPALLGEFQNVVCEPNSLPSPAAVSLYDKVGLPNVINFLANHRTLWQNNHKAWLAEVAKVLAMPGQKYAGRDQAWGLANLISYGLTPESPAQAKPTAAMIKPMWDYYLAEEEKTQTYDAGQEGAFYGLYLNSGLKDDAAAHMAAYLQTIKKRTPAQQIEAITSLFRTYNLPTETVKDPNGKFVGGPVAGQRYFLIINVLKPLYEQMPKETWTSVPIHWTILDGLLQVVRDWPDCPARKDALAEARLLVNMLMAGARLEANGAAHLPLVDLIAKDDLASQNWNSLVQELAYYALTLNYQGGWDDYMTTYIVPMTKVLEDKQAFEMEYAFMTAIERRTKPPEKTLKQVLIVKAKAGTQIPGLILVPANDPTYDLHMAANALAIGNDSRAWELTAPKLALLTKNWETLDADYVAWSVEQMRKQKLLKEALEFAFTILTRETDLDPEMAAKVVLTKGDTYRDMENYQAAKAEYEGLRNSPRYKKTEAGLKGLYRLVDLLIITKDYTTATGILDRLVDSESLEVQAEGYYLYAKMAFQQEDWKASMDYIKKVKQRMPSHVEAEFLEGELKLKVPGGLQNPDLPIGDPRLATVAIPGRTLTLKLQDTNLAIARGGAAIPVVVRTTVGHDEEHVKLLPSSSDKTLFTGTINTGLGKVVPGDLVLELRGDDRVTYEIEPDFQKANGLSYPPKVLDVRYDPYLAVSSGEILTEEEEQKRELDHQLKLSLENLHKWEQSRNNAIVRPGSRLFVQVTDFAADLSDQKCKVPVDIQTSSGDILDGYELTETQPHSGLFRAAIPTDLPLPRVTDSDHQEGKSSASLARPDAGSGWASLDDGKKPKWIEIDTMSSYEVKASSIDIPTLAAVKQISVQGVLAGDYEELAAFPERKGVQQGGLKIEMTADHVDGPPDLFRKFFKMRPSDSLFQDSPAFDRNKTPYKGRGGGTTARMVGTFYLTENRALELRFIPELSTHGNGATAYLFIDDQQILGGHLDENMFKVTRRADLIKGPHRMEILLSDGTPATKLAVGYMKDDGTVEPLPAAWFSVKDSPDLANSLKPKGKFETAGSVLSFTLDQPRRFRKLRWVFEDFSGAVSVKAARLQDSNGLAIIPMKPPAATSAPVALKVAPGDEIVVTYKSDKATSVDKGTLTRKLSASYFNGNIVLANEAIETNDQGQRLFRYYPIKRCRMGDQLAVIVTDYDEDRTDERDVVDVNIRTSGGESIVVKTLETDLYGDRSDEERNRHAGTFLGFFKLGQTTGKDTIRLQRGDVITASYLDKENTDPGVPVERTYSATEASGGHPAIVLYETDVQQVVDNSPEARLKVIRARAGAATSMPTIYRDDLLVRHPDYVAPAAAGASAAASRPSGEPVLNVAAPLLFEVNYPKYCLNSNSILKVSVVADSELKAAAKAGREPNRLVVPMYVQNIQELAAEKGYPIRLMSHIRRTPEDMLRDGMFAGIVRLQMGSPGDPIDDLVVTGEKEFAAKKEIQTERDEYRYRVSTLIVSGSDVVHIAVTDGNEVVAKASARLLSNGRMELMDSIYTAQCEAIHLGEKFYVRVTDAKRDISDSRDSVPVNVRTSSGAHLTMTLTETLNHSGVFTGMIKPEFVGLQAASAPAPAVAPASAPSGDPKRDLSRLGTPDVLRVNFGDNVFFEYVDPENVKSATPVTVSKKGFIYRGSDGEVALFSKKFKDPEMAIKTNFLTAEALFEMAKEHRKLQQVPIADEEIAHGKRILEEAMRDYPNTSLAAQGEYLLANLSQELNNNLDAISKYSSVISSWPESDYAARSQFKKAICYEKMGNNEQACEEYVKVIYIYPDSGLVADATVRLGNYYYRQSAYRVAGMIFFKFQQKDPQNLLAPKSLFLAAQCYYKMEDWTESAKLFNMLVDQYPNEKDLRSESMYWLADSYSKKLDYQKAYQFFKKVTWDYPESQWAKIARGRLTEEIYDKME